MKALYQAPEHEFEAAPGLPQALPPSERILWQGSPGTWQTARDILHLRGVALYFAVLLAWRGLTALAEGAGALEALSAVLWLLPLPAIGLALIWSLAWLVSRTSVYTITSKRIVLRIGVVLNVTFNLPFSRIESAGVRRRLDGSGDLSLRLEAPNQIAYVHLWPHARPWHLRRTEPSLRCLPEVDAVAGLLAQALAEAARPASSGAVPAATSPAPATQATGPEGVAVRLPKSSTADNRWAAAA